MSVLPTDTGVVVIETMYDIKNKAKSGANVLFGVQRTTQSNM